MSKTYILKFTGVVFIILADSPQQAWESLMNHDEVKGIYDEFFQMGGVGPEDLVCLSEKGSMAIVPLF